MDGIRDGCFVLVALAFIFIITIAFLIQIEPTNGIMINLLGEGDITLPFFRNYNPCSHNQECINGYVPEYVCIVPKTNVTWVNVGDIYRTVTAGDEINGPTGEFDSGTIGMDEKFTYTFTQKGKVTYFDTIHDSLSGVIEVDDNCATPIIKHSFGSESMGGYNSNNSEFVTYNNSMYEIQVLYPLEWEEVNYNFSNTDRRNVLSLDRSNSNGEFEIWIKDRQNKTLEQIHNATADCNKDNEENVKVIEINHNASIAGYPAYSIKCTYEDESYDPKKREIMMLSSIIDDKIIEILYDDAVRSFPVYITNVERMIDSFKFTK